jgi:hypothetical protein
VIKLLNNSQNKNIKNEIAYVPFSHPKTWVALIISYTLSLQGIAVVAARATRLPIYSSFAKEGNLSDLFAKGEAISTLFNVMGIGAGIGLASTVCSTTQGKVHK